MKIPFAMAAALVLSGCGVPPLITMASAALDSMSLLSTGKSFTGHAMSAATKKDCAVWRVVGDQDVCREFDAGKKSRLVVAAENWERGFEIVGLTESEPYIVRRATSKPVMLALVDPVVLPQFAADGAATPDADRAGLDIRLPSGPVAESFLAIEPAPDADRLAPGSAEAPWVLPLGRAPADAIERARERPYAPPPVSSGAVHDASSGAPEPAKVLVLGSFARLDNAKRVARMRSGLRPAIVRTRLGGATFYRVIVGTGGVDRRRQLASLGQSAWAADVCAPGSIGNRCVVLPAVFRR